MFVNFNKVFKKSTESKIKIPEALIDELSSKLPEGLKYCFDSNSNTLVIADDSQKGRPITLSGLIFFPNDKQKAVLGNNYTPNDIFNYSYNSQQPIPLRFENEGMVKLNGEDIPIDQLTYNPFNPLHFVKDSAYLQPPPFINSRFPLKISSKESAIILSISRIPNNSVNTMAFESDNSKCLALKYYLNPVNSTISITINISIENAKTVMEIIESIEIYNAFVDGKGYLADSLIQAKLAVDNKKFDEALLFWRKVNQIEKALNIDFLPPFTRLDFDTICEIEELYQNLIKITPIRTNEKINNLNSSDDVLNELSIKKLVDKPMYFEFECTESLVLFGKSLTFPCIMGVFNAVISKFEFEESQHKWMIFLKDESDDKKMYTTRLCFVNDNDLSKYKKKNSNRIMLFSQAKKRHEYLQ